MNAENLNLPPSYGSKCLLCGQKYPPNGNFFPMANSIVFSGYEIGMYKIDPKKYEVCKPCCIRQTREVVKVKIGDESVFQKKDRESMRLQKLLTKKKNYYMTKTYVRKQPCSRCGIRYSQQFFACIDTNDSDRKLMKKPFTILPDTLIHKHKARVFCQGCFDSLNKEKDAEVRAKKFGNWDLINDEPLNPNENEHTEK